MTAELLDIAIKSLEKEFGSGVLIKGDDQITVRGIVRTGSRALDKAIGVGGYPLGAIIEAYGTEGAGKTTIGLHAIAEVQKMGLQAAFIDAEHGLDLNYAKALGVNISELWFSQPTHAREALTIIQTLLETEKFGIIVVDSVAALITEQELGGKVGDANVAPLARLMSEFLRRIAGLSRKSKTIVFFINQLRDNIGFGYGSKEVTPGGRALKFYATLRLDIRIREKIKDVVDIVGNVVRVKVVKNKVAPPFRVCDFNLIFGKGIDILQELIDEGLDKGIIVKSGAWYKLGEEKFQGVNNVKEYLQNNPDKLEILEKEVFNDGV